MLALFGPQGFIAAQEVALMARAAVLMLIVIVPVLALLFFFAWRYRAGNTKATYLPHWEHAKMDELIWWAIPFEIVLVLAAITYSSSHDLDPHKPLDPSLGKPLVVQVVALPWRWLFIYPSLGIAAVNLAEVPAGVPVDFEVTADAPMNSFWVPALGGQIYAMTGMVNPLYLIAGQPGEYAGRSANYSGAGFASMRFVVRAADQPHFDAWVAQTKHSTSTLSAAAYAALAQPSTESAVQYFGAVEPNLFSLITSQFDH